ncbi:MAG: hypothetical protein COA84_07455 [Robiginitomaculum sp.]|nr:MAG: hypothetical protein COA84_07455 [Robiginitomaculum sp.]
MRELLKRFLDHDLDRRGFIQKTMAMGMSTLGATALANTLGGEAQAATSESDDAPELSRFVHDLTGGDLMCEFLRDWNIPYIFGLAGSEEVGFLDALVDRPDIGYVTCIHEHVAMAMADGYSRSTGRTSIVQLHSVAGASYALGQLVGSFRDRIPVVVTAGRQATEYRGHDGFLEADDLQNLPGDYAIWNWDVMSPNTIAEVLRRAFLLAEAPPGGPTFVTFSKDLWEMNVKKAEIIPRSRSHVDTDVAPTDAIVKKIADLLIASSRPILFLGNECIKTDISDTVAAIAETVGALVLTSSKIPIVFPTTHPHFGGQFNTDDPDLNPSIDCFWSIGAPLFKISSRPKNNLIKRTAKIIHTSLVDHEVSRNYPTDIAVIASIKATSEAVLAELQSRGDLKDAKARRTWVTNYTKARRRSIQAQLEQEFDSTPISPERLVSELDTHMDKSAYIVSEIVTNDNLIRKLVSFDHTRPVEKRRRNFDTTSGILGWGVSAAIGVKLGNPDKEVWCWSGDGSFNFGSQALWTLSRYDANVGIVVFNNGQYQANRLNQARYKGRMYETDRYLGVNLTHPDIDYVKMAQAYDIEGERVSDPDDITAAIARCRKVMKSGRPYLLDIKIKTKGPGKDMAYYDYFSIGQGKSRRDIERG